MHMIKWAALLGIFWLLLSGYIQPLLLSFGVISVVIVLLIINKMDKVDQHQGHVKTSPQSIGYFVWLIGQIFSSSIRVTRLIWGPTDKLSPSLDRINVKDVPEENRVLYANSITLTPGTLSLDMNEDEITVHALEKPSIDELEGGDMEVKVSKIGSKP